MRRLLPICACALVSLAACGEAADEPPAPASLTPRFAPEQGAGASTTTQPPAAVPADPATAETSTTVADVTTTVPQGAAGADPARSHRATVTDRAGDVTPAVGEQVPGWADLTGAELQTAGARLELRVGFAAAAPSRSPDGEHTMNVAVFFDVDGDGAVDYEVWANLAESGWGGAWYDNGARTARFTDESGVAASVEDGRLVLRFPAGHVGAATRFRWSVASEWGRYETIGTVLAARDDAPDDDGSVAFPA